MTVRTRFAPSPTGPLHLGHAYAALFASDVAAASGGTFLLRIEDIDRARARPEWERAIQEDLSWLGLSWPTPVMRQSDRLDAYRAALDRLWREGLLYPCDCRRRDIAEAVAAPQEGSPPMGPDGLIYPGLCRGRSRFGPLPSDGALRLDMSEAMARVGSLSYQEFGENGFAKQIDLSRSAMVSAVGDIVLARRDMGTSYHLSVVVDDADQQITDVTRGADLEPATAIHVVLQALLGLPTPRYRHHRLIRDASGKRLAKRDDSRAIRLYRQEGCSPQDLRRMVDPPEA